MFKFTDLKAKIFVDVSTRPFQIYFDKVGIISSLNKTYEGENQEKKKDSDEETNSIALDLK